MKKMILAPSILSADFSNLERDVKKAELAGAQWLHIDVMDGHFVPNISFGIPVVESIRKCSNLFFDVHLMIKNTEKYIEPFVKAGADGITVHYESVADMDLCINLIKSFGKKVGIAINPDTPYTAVVPYLDRIDMVLVMSVFPGYGGQKYIEDVNEKIVNLRKIVGEDFFIEVDGGIKTDNLKSVLDNGANVIVAGTAVFNDDIEGSIKKFKEVAEL